MKRLLRKAGAKGRAGRFELAGIALMLGAYWAPGSWLVGFALLILGLAFDLAQPGFQGFECPMCACRVSGFRIAEPPTCSVDHPLVEMRPSTQQSGERGHLNG